MAAKKYPIGTKIIFIAHAGMCHQARQDDGKKGRIIGETSAGRVKIFLPDSVKNWGTEYTWNTGWDDIKPISVKGQQLLFAFME